MTPENFEKKRNADTIAVLSRQMDGIVKEAVDIEYRMNLLAIEMDKLIAQKEIIHKALHKCSE